MRSILGIDAAWTHHNPSGVALIGEKERGWRCIAVAPSYATFLALLDGRSVNWAARAEGSPPDVAALIDASARRTGVRPTLVTVDMPLATGPITGRRTADTETSRIFGGFGCAVHSPTAARPGPLAHRVMVALAQVGYPLATAETSPGNAPAALEVYPHAAIVRFLGLHKRLKYKVARAAKLWPGTSVEERIAHLLDGFETVWRMIATRVESVDLPLPSPSDVSTLAALKPYEDALDALVCACVGITYLDGRAEALGDDTAAIWVPRGHA